MAYCISIKKSLVKLKKIMSLVFAVVIELI